MTENITTVVSADVLAQLKESYPIEESFHRLLLPRLGLRSQDVREGKGKAMKVTEEAGTFYIERQTDELNENDKKIWKKEEIGTQVEIIILYHRKQLRFYDSSNEIYTSSPIYDTNDQVIPLFCNKVEVDRGTPDELKSRPIYQGISAKGKPISKLEENRILYALYKNEMFQVSLRGTSMYAFLSYARTVLPPTVVTSCSSEAREQGTINWNQMTFLKSRDIDAKEAEEVLGRVAEIKTAIESEKNYYGKINTIDTSVAFPRPSSEGDPDLEPLF